MQNNLKLNKQRQIPITQLQRWRRKAIFNLFDFQNQMQQFIQVSLYQLLKYIIGTFYYQYSHFTSLMLLLLKPRGLLIIFCSYPFSFQKPFAFIIIFSGNFSSGEQSQLIQAQIWNRFSKTAKQLKLHLLPRFIQNTIQSAKTIGIIKRQSNYSKFNKNTAAYYYWLMYTISSIQKESISANSIEFLNLYNNQQLLKMKKQVSTKSQSFHSPLTNAASPPFFGQNSIPFQNQNIQVKNQGIKNRNSASKMSPFTLHNFKKGHCALLSLYRNSKSMKQHVFSFSQMIKQIQNVLFASAQFQQFCTNSNQSCIYDTIEIEDFITQNLSHLGTTLITRLLDILKMKKKLRMMLQIIYDYVSQSIVRDLILAGCYAILEYQNISQFKLDREEVEQLATDHGFIARMFSDPTMWLLGLSQFQSNSSFMGSKLGQQLCLFMPFYSLTILLVFDNYNDNSYYELLAEREWKHRKQSQFRKRIHKFRENKLVKQKGM